MVTVPELITKFISPIPEIFIVHLAVIASLLNTVNPGKLSSLYKSGLWLPNQERTPRIDSRSPSQLQNGLEWVYDSFSIWASNNFGV